jgi:hypothetical protein
MKQSEFRALIREEIKKVIRETSSPLASKLSKLYGAIVTMQYVDDESMDEVMEKIVKKAGYTPAQKKIKSAYKFAFGGHPEFETLSDNQLKALEPFLKAVDDRGYFDSGDKWTGSKIKEENF